MHDQRANGRRFRLLTIVSNFSRVSPAIEVEVSLTGWRVIQVFNRLKVERGLPKILCFDSGTEFTSKVVDAWAYENGVQLDFSRPGTLTDNPFIECLNQRWFTSLEDARGANRSLADRLQHEPAPFGVGRGLAPEFRTFRKLVLAQLVLRGVP